MNTEADLHADYVVIGTGSAGAVVINRLSADSGSTVVALEAGREDKDKFVHIPAAFAKLFRSEMDWDYLTEPQKELQGRQIFWPRGKMFGGSSSMNAMMWVRGFAADYDEWAEHAGDQWSYANLVDYFRRIENATDAWSFIDGDESGVTGPLTISAQRSPRASTAAWLSAARECGYPLVRPNSKQPEGFSQTVVCQRRGSRWSTADAYLRPVQQRRNLTVLAGAQATRIVIENGRAVGVEFHHEGRRRVVHADREVVLCGGAVNSPQLLMLSGIGDRDHLQMHGIETVHHSPEVGQNLTDHLLTVLGFSVERDSLFAAEKPAQLANYLLRRRGMLTSNVGEAYGFIRSRPELELPDVELIFAPAPFFDEGLEGQTGHAVAFGPILVKPQSRGQITLRSADPFDKPVIDPRYLSDPEGIDREAMMAGLRASARIAQSAPMRSLITGIVRPLDGESLDDETLQRALETCAHTLYHPTTTCRMGSDESSVVDPELRVRGVDALRIADASVMPTIIRGHTHAPSVLIGEKAADLIRG